MFGDTLNHAREREKERERERGKRKEERKEERGERREERGERRENREARTDKREQTTENREQRTEKVFVGTPLVCGVLVVRHCLPLRPLGVLSGHPRPPVVTAPSAVGVLAGPTGAMIHPG